MSSLHRLPSQVGRRVLTARGWLFRLYACGRSVYACSAATAHHPSQTDIDADPPNARSLVRNFFCPATRPGMFSRASTHVSSQACCLSFSVRFTDALSKLPSKKGRFEHILPTFPFVPWVGSPGLGCFGSPPCSRWCPGVTASHLNPAVCRRRTCRMSRSQSGGSAGKAFVCVCMRVCVCVCVCLFFVGCLFSINSYIIGALDWWLGVLNPWLL